MRAEILSVIFKGMEEDAGTVVMKALAKAYDEQLDVEAEEGGDPVNYASNDEEAYAVWVKAYDGWRAGTAERRSALMPEWLEGCSLTLVREAARCERQRDDAMERAFRVMARKYENVES